MSKVILSEISMKYDIDTDNNYRDDIKGSINSINNHLSGSSSSILEYASIHGGSLMNLSRSISTENKSSNFNNQANMKLNNSENSSITISRYGSNSSSGVIHLKHNDSDISKIAEYSDNKKPVVRNAKLKSIEASDSIEQHTGKNLPPKDIDLTRDLFFYIDRAPAYPPNYDDINPVRNIKFPIFENTVCVNKNEKPPKYTPTINKIIIASFKLERVSPYEPSTSRSWKDYIVEINSTQLNFYSITDTIVDKIKSLKNDNPYHYDTGKDNNNNDMSIKSVKTKKSTGFLSKLSKDNSTFDLDENEQAMICSHIDQNRSKYMLPSNIFKTYSLQYAKYGIPIDYHKKPFVLRLRCESEQFLIGFNNIDDMIMWSVYLSIGISVSLDLELRDLPNYRVVPRRRRHHRHRHHRRHHHNPIHFHGLNHIKINESTNSNSNISKYDSIPKISRSYSLSSMRIDTPMNNSNRNDSHLSGNISTLFEGSIANFAESDNATKTVEKRLSSGEHVTRTLDTVVVGNTLAAVNSKYDPNKLNKGAADSKINVSFTSKMRHLFKLKKSFSDFNEKKTIKYVSSTNISRDTSINSNRYLRTRAMSSPVIANASKTHSSTDNNSVVNRECNNNIHDTRARERRITENVIQEIHNHHRMCAGRNRTESSFEDSENDNEYEVFDNVDDNFADDENGIDNSNNECSGIINNEREISIYTEEGYFDDEDEDEEDGFNDGSLLCHGRDGSTTYGNQHAITVEEYPYDENDNGKWLPIKKEMSRKRYIKDSLRCIRPFVEDQEWIGHVVFRPTKEPGFRTNNPPIWIGNNNGKKKFGYLSSSDYSNVKNHYLKPYIVGPVGFLKADSKVASQFNLLTR